MREKFTYVPPGAVPSPDESIQTTLHPKLYNAVFAVMLADSIGDLDPLIARLNAVTDLKCLEPIEREFVADLLRRRPKRWPKGTVPGSLKTNRKKLCVAAYFLEFARGEPPEGQVGKALEHARDRCGLSNRRGDPLDPRVIRRYVDEAKKVTYQWRDRQHRWWDIAAKMAREGKLEQLHRTY
jgi:hypothetical protein